MQEHILVTGGGGFLGSAVCRQLIEKGYKVTSFSRKSYKDLENIGVRCVQGSLDHQNDIESLMEQKFNGIIHCAAKAGIWGAKKDFLQTNLVGTQTLLHQAKRHGISRFVYTSSPSVVFAKQDLCNADESIKYPTRHYADYPYSKMLAEKAVLSAADSKLSTVALRPHLIWGPNDPHFLPRLQERARLGQLKKVGEGKNRVDIIYVDNAAQAHIQALEALTANQKISGKAYFIGQEQSVNLWDFINKLLASMGLEPIRKSISYTTAWYTGWVCEKFYQSFKIFDKDPPMTRFLASQLACSHYFNHNRAKRDFSYKAEISTHEGLRRLKAFYASSN